MMDLASWATTVSAIRRGFRGLGFGVMLAVFGITAGAEELTWNGAAGIWDTTTPNWLSTAGSVPWPTTGTENEARFADLANPVTLLSDVVANGLEFATDGYSISGTGSITFNGAAPSVDVAAGTATIGSSSAIALRGSGGLTKVGPGTLILDGSEPHGLTGGLTVAGGRLVANSASLLTPVNFFPAGNQLTVANGTLELIASPSGGTTQAFDGLSVGSGRGLITMNAAAGSLVVDFGTVTQREAGGIVMFGGVTTATGRVTNTPTAFLAPWALAGDSTTGSVRWAYVNAEGRLTTVFGSNPGANWVNMTSPNAVYTVTGSPTLAANATAFGIQNNETANRTVTLANSTFTTGGIAKLTAFTDTYTASGGTGVVQVGTGNDLVVIGPGNVTFSAPVVDGVAGNSAVTQAGGGTLRFDTAASTYTGPTTVNSGVLRVATGGSINASSGVVVNGGRFAQANAATAVAPPVSLRSGAVDGTGVIQSLAVADSASARLTNGDGTTAALTLGSLAFAGDATVDINTAGSAGILVTGPLSTTPTAGTVTVNVTTAPIWTAGQTYNLIGYGSWSGAVADFSLGAVPGLGVRKSAVLGSTGPTNGFLTLSIQGESVVWTGATNATWVTAADPNWRLQNAGTQTDFLAGDDVIFDDSAVGSTTVDISAGGVSPTTTTFANSVREYVITSSGGYGIDTGSLTKNGSGTARLETINSFTGPTTVNAGTLVLASGLAIADTGAVTLADAAGATLQVAFSETIGGLNGGGSTGGRVQLDAGQLLWLGSGTHAYSGVVVGDGLLVNAGATQTISGPISTTGGLTVSSGRLNLGVANSYSGGTSIDPGAVLVVTANGALGATGLGNETTVGGSGGLLAGVLGLTSVDYSTAEKVVGSGLGNTAATLGLGAVQRGFVQGVSGSSRFAGDIEINTPGVSRLGVQDRAQLELAGSIRPTEGVTGVTMLFRAGDINGDFVTLSSSDNAWDTNTAIYTGNNIAGQYAGVRLGVTNALPTNVSVYGGPSAQLGTTLDLAGFDQTVSGLTGAAYTSTPGKLRITNLRADSTSVLTLDVAAPQNTGQTVLEDGPTGGVVSLVKTGVEKQTLGGVSTYSGSTTIRSGTLALAGAGSIARSSLITVGDAGSTDAVFDLSAATTPAIGAGQTLAGQGTVAGSATLSADATLSPGAGVGTLTFTQGLTWSEAAAYDWQLFDAAGTAGTAWDLAAIGGELAITATAASPFTVNLWTVSSTDPQVNGPALNFDSGVAQTWTIATAAGGITGFAADAFTVVTSPAHGTGGFANDLHGGGFSVTQVGNDLLLSFTPGGSPTDIVIDVPSGSQTQAQAGYPTIAAATSVTKIGAGTLVFDAANAYDGPTAVSAGTLQVANANSLQSTPVTVGAAATLEVASGTTLRTPSVTVAGGTLASASLAVNDSTGITALAINSGTLAGAPSVAITTGGSLSLAADRRVLVGVGSLSVDQAAGGGKLDVGAGQVTIAAGGISAAELRADIIAGRNGGAWNGATGITSSTAASTTGRAVGYVVSGDGSARVSFAASGDVDLSGTVNVFDLVAINSGGKYGTGGSAVWSQGDFNYDGVTNVFDLVAVNTAGAYGQGNYFPAAPTVGSLGSPTAVPEPGTWALLASALALGRWGRRRVSPRG